MDARRVAEVLDLDEAVELHEGVASHEQGHVDRSTGDAGGGALGRAISLSLGRREGLERGDGAGLLRRLELVNLRGDEVTGAHGVIPGDVLALGVVPAGHGDAFGDARARDTGTNGTHASITELELGVAAHGSCGLLRRTEEQLGLSDGELRVDAHERDPALLAGEAYEEVPVGLIGLHDKGMGGAGCADVAAEEAVERVVAGDLLRDLAVGHVLEGPRAPSGHHLVGTVVGAENETRAVAGIGAELATGDRAAEDDVAGEVAEAVGEDGDGLADL